jgi:hypothetical protein
MRILVFLDEAPLLQAAEHVANDRPADFEMVGEFSLYQAISAEHQACGDIVLHGFVNSLPRGAALHRVIDRLRDTKADLAQIAPDGIERLACPPLNRRTRPCASR